MTEEQAQVDQETAIENSQLVRLSNVKIYQGATLVLDDVNVTVNKGEVIYLIGKTGSGKSSLLKVMYADLPLAEGEGEVVGFDLNGMTRKKLSFLRRRLGIVFQDFQLLTDRNVEENLRFALKATGWKDKKEMDKRIEEVLSLVQLKGKGFKNPFELSGGEQQRVVIARALLNHPELILADEPTGNLDPDTSDDIIKLLMSISKESGTAILLATHDYTLLDKYPSRIIKVQEGKLVDFKHTTVDS
jgi:cell division transport system ATP-binding protein